MKWTNLQVDQDKGWRQRQRQWSNLGLLFFLIYINDLSSEVSCSLKLLADNTSLSSVVKDVNETTKKLNKDLDNITK